jgi:hypothetical protein
VVVFNVAYLLNWLSKIELLELAMGLISLRFSDALVEFSCTPEVETILNDEVANIIN